MIPPTRFFFFNKKEPETNAEIRKNKTQTYQIRQHRNQCTEIFYAGNEILVEPYGSQQQAT